MDSGPTIVLAAVAAAVAVVAVVLLAVLVAGRRARRRTDAALAASRAELEELQQRLDSLAEQLAVRSAARPVERASGAPVPRHRKDEPEYVITTAGRRGDRQTTDEVAVSAPPAVDARQFASVALGESLVRLVSLGYGVRRALSAENRNRIAFEMRREVRRSRKDRRRELRDLRRRLREVPEPEERADPADRTESAA